MKIKINGSTPQSDKREISKIMNLGMEMKNIFKPGQKNQVNEEDKACLYECSVVWDMSPTWTLISGKGGKTICFSCIKKWKELTDTGEKKRKNISTKYQRRGWTGEFTFTIKAVLGCVSSQSKSL